MTYLCDRIRPGNIRTEIDQLAVLQGVQNWEYVLRKFGDTVETHSTSSPSLFNAAGDSVCPAVQHFLIDYLGKLVSGDHTPFVVPGVEHLTISPCVERSPLPILSVASALHKLSIKIANPTSWFCLQILNAAPNCAELQISFEEVRGDTDIHGRLVDEEKTGRATADCSKRKIVLDIVDPNPDNDWPVQCSGPPVRMMATMTSTQIRRICLSAGASDWLDFPPTHNDWLCLCLTKVMGTFGLCNVWNHDGVKYPEVLWKDTCLFCSFFRDSNIP